jgi:hypothetical protein
MSNLAEYGHMTGRNKEGVCYVYSIFSYTYAHLLVLTAISKAKELFLFLAPEVINFLTTAENVTLSA